MVVRSVLWQLPEAIIPLVDSVGRHHSVFLTGYSTSTAERRRHTETRRKTMKKQVSVEKTVGTFSLSLYLVLETHGDQVVELAHAGFVEAHDGRVGQLQN